MKIQYSILESSRTSLQFSISDKPAKPVRTQENDASYMILNGVLVPAGVVNA